MRFKVYLPLEHPYRNFGGFFFFKTKTQFVIDMRKFPPYLAGQPDQIMKEHLPVEKVSVLSRERCSLEKNSTVFIFTYEIGFI